MAYYHIYEAGSIYTLSKSIDDDTQKWVAFEDKAF